jgi:hypothetical protein
MSQSCRKNLAGFKKFPYTKISLSNADNPRTKLNAGERSVVSNSASCLQRLGFDSQLEHRLK